MTNNLDALLTIVKYIYDNIQYAEFNTKSDYCHKCGFDGEIKINDEGQWECPQCGNTDRKELTVVRRTCGKEILDSYTKKMIETKGKSERIIFSQAY